jgi:hypothetical protein
MNAKIQRRLERMNVFVEQLIERNMTYFWASAKRNLSVEEYRRYLSFFSKKLKHPHLEIPSEIQAIEQKIFDSDNQLERLVDQVIKLRYARIKNQK